MNTPIHPAASSAAATGAAGLDPVVAATAHAQGGAEPAGSEQQSWDSVESYFECITTCSLDDGTCITECVQELREHH